MTFLTIFYLLNPKIFLKYWLGKVYFYHTTNKSINVPLMVLKSEDFFKVLQVLHNVKLCKTCVSIFLNLLGISSMIVDYLVKLIYVSVYIIFIVLWYLLSKLIFSTSTLYFHHFTLNKGLDYLGIKMNKYIFEVCFEVVFNKNVYGKSK